ncbi:MAG: DsbA family oxidoreductase [Pseudomonadota bacterium]|nr:DsbA family oxidoreductase [Pseudomonadota bacterium]
MNNQHIDIKIVFDPGCPWCLIGGKRLEQAMAKAVEKDYTFRVKWLPFMLAPDTGTEGTPSREHMIAMIGEEAYIASRERMRPIGKSIGIEWASDKGKGVIASTLRSLCLIDWAWEEGLKTSEEEAQRIQCIAVNQVFKIVFEDGENVSDPHRLRNVAEFVGLDADAAEEHFMSKAAQNNIKTSIASCPYMQASGGRGVPVFAFNEKYILTGGQEVDAFLQAFDQVAAA